MTDTTDRSRRAQKAPLPPDVLADARHDRTHENSGRLLKASPIVVSDHAALLRDLDSAAAGVQRLDREDAESAAKAIRGLEATVRELEEPTFCEECGKSIHDCNMDYWREKAEKAFADYAELRADRDRLAGEVERLTKHVSRLEHANATAFSDRDRLSDQLDEVSEARDRLEDENARLAGEVERLKAAESIYNNELRLQVARLTSELEKARENEARWLWMFPADPLISVTERMQRVYRKWDGSGSWNDAVDAARRAGEGEAK